MVSFRVPAHAPTRPASVGGVYDRKTAPKHVINTSYTGYLAFRVGIYLVYWVMLTLSSIGKQLAMRRKSLKISQAALAKQAQVGHSTIDALENSRIGELGFSKISKILSVLGLELEIQEAADRRPTVEELLKEDRDDQGLDRQR